LGHKGGHLSTKWAEISNLKPQQSWGNDGTFLHDGSPKGRRALPNTDRCDL